MSKKDRIILTGFMGTGKTAVGEVLALRLGLPFRDTDQMVEKETGLTIPEIFDKKGEDFFREIEKKMVKKALSDEKVVVATGGGAVLDPENLTLMKEKGILIALSSSPEIISSRLTQFENRPLLKGKDRLERIRQLFSKRSPFYEQADHIIDTSGKKIEEAVEEIMKILGTNA
jgi:shikimate kinase